MACFGKRHHHISLQTILQIVACFWQHVTCQRPGDLRLMNGGQSSQGRVEVYIGDLNYGTGWGTVCDDKWDDVDAGVVCRQLGYSDINAMAKHAAYFGMGSGLIYLDNVECDGSESRIVDCAGGRAHSNCEHTEDAGVVCEPKLFDVRLSDGSVRTEGRVEVFDGELWGTVCHNRWDDWDAMVVCRQVGYPDYYAQAEMGGVFQRGIGFILMDNVKCRGSEPALSHCGFVDGNANSCSHNEDAGVRCYETEPSANSGPTPFVSIMSVMGGFLVILVVVAIAAKKCHCLRNLRLMHQKHEARRRSSDRRSSVEMTDSHLRMGGSHGDQDDIRNPPTRSPSGAFPLRVDIGAEYDVHGSIYGGSMISGVNTHRLSVTMAVQVCEPPPPYISSNENEPLEATPEENSQPPPPYEMQPPDTGSQESLPSLLSPVTRHTNN